MALKLGELLVSSGIVTRAQLDEALKSQIIFGGRLGTNLIEMGCLEEDSLARILSEKLRVPCVDPNEIMAIPPSVIALITTEEAEKFKIVPVRLDIRRLSLAMADPTDFPALDAIAFRTGCVIQPMVSPEIRLAQALEKHYGIKREQRCLPVSRGLGGRRVSTNQTKPVETAVTPREVFDFSTLPDDAGLADVGLWGGGASAGYAEAVERFTVDALSRQLAEVRDRDAVAAALADYLGHEFERAGVLLVMKDEVRGWEGRASGERIEAFGELRLGLSLPSVLRTVVQDKEHHLGPLADLPQNYQLRMALRGETQPAFLLVPMILSRRVVAVFCVGGPSEQLSARLPELVMLAHKGALAFEILILRNKILLT